MLSRKEQERAGVPLPEKWCENAEATLYAAYQNYADQQKKEFQFHGFTYEDEVFIAASYLDSSNLLDAPVTYLVSVDLEEGKKADNILEVLLDSMGIFFDGYFSDPDWNAYEANWTEAEFKKQPFYYRVTRENVALTLQAERLLNQ